jgi:hypothetical protein
MVLAGEGCKPRDVCYSINSYTRWSERPGAFLSAERKAHSAPTFDQEIPVKDFGERIMKASNCLLRLSKGKITRWREDEAGSVSIKIGKLMIVCVLAVFLISLSHFVKETLRLSSAKQPNQTTR